MNIAAKRSGPTSAAMRSIGVAALPSSAGGRDRFVRDRGGLGLGRLALEPVPGPDREGEQHHATQDPAAQPFVGIRRRQFAFLGVHGKYSS
jgi:hypothetical protein